jgi:hypothetical protein
VILSIVNDLLNRAIVRKDKAGLTSSSNGNHVGKDSLIKFTQSVYNHHLKFCLIRKSNIFKVYEITLGAMPRDRPSGASHRVPRFARHRAAEVITNCI